MTYMLTVNEAGMPVFNENNTHVLLTNALDQSISWIEATPELLSSFGFQVQEDSSCNKVVNAPSPTPTREDESEQPSNWKGRDDAVRFLLSKWKDHDADFKSTSIKNECVWAMIAKELSDANPAWKYTWQQCENKFKYLRKEYVKTKDFNSKSGNAPKTCSFYEEMDEILGDKPCVKPVALASSTVKRKRQTTPDVESSANDTIVNSSDSSPEVSSTSSESEDGKDKVTKEACTPTATKKKKKKTKKTKVQKELESWTNLLRKDAEKREKARAKRFEKGLKVYEDTMQKLIDKL